MVVDDDAILSRTQHICALYSGDDSSMNSTGASRLCRTDCCVCVCVSAENAENVFRGFNNNIKSMLVILFHVKIFNKLYAAHSFHLMRSLLRVVRCRCIIVLLKLFFGHIPHRNVTNGDISLVATGVRKKI